jgi:2-oxoisovalerate dehydrogenase E1 component
MSTHTETPPSQLLQVLDSGGQLVGDPPALSDDQLVELFSGLVRTRAFDRRATALRRQGRLGEYYTCEGQEALAGAAYALGPEDWIFTQYRDQPAWFMRGLPCAAVLALYRGVPPRAWDTNRYRITRMNATIGTHLPHAVGFAHASRARGEELVTLAIFSDGATSEGDFHAGLNFAGVLRTPTVFVCQNNQYAQTVPVEKQTAGVIADKALGYGMPGLRVDGMDPLAMHTATSVALERARGGDGPTLIEMVTYRYHGHATFESNPLPYRPAGEPEEWMAKDPLDRMRRFLQSRGLVDDATEQAWTAAVQSECEQAIGELEATGIPSRGSAIRNTYERIPPAVVEHLHRTEDDLGEPRSEIAGDEVFQAGPAQPLPAEPRELITHVEAIRRALLAAMRRDPEMVCIGEDVAADGGCFKATDGFLEEFGPGRVIDSPLCETGIVGTAVGMAMAGTRVMAEIQLAGFTYPAIDQIIGHAARVRWRYQGARDCPLVVRAPGGGGFRGHEFHMDCPEALIMHMPGVTIVSPSDPVEAKGLLAAALEHADPTYFFEPIGLYRTQKAEVPTEHYTIPLGRANVSRAGDHVTVVAYGRQVGKALAAAELAQADGISVEVIDLRTLRPWDEQTVFESVARTGRLVTAHDAHRAAGVGAEVVARVCEEVLDSLVAPAVRVAPWDVNRPSLKAEELTDVDERWILGAIRRTTEGSGAG